MASVTRFIERRLRLKVNVSKSAVARPQERHFLGFSLWRHPRRGYVEVRLSKRSEERLAAKIVELTPRWWGNSLRACIRRINAYLRGWLGFFGICNSGIRRLLRFADAHIRRRLRAIQLKHWKQKLYIVRGLIRLGARRASVWRDVYGGRRSTWALSQVPSVRHTLSPAYFSDLGLVSLEDSWRAQSRLAQVTVTG